MAKVVVQLDVREQALVNQLAKYGGFPPVEDWETSDWQDFDNIIRVVLDLPSGLIYSVDYGFLLK